MGRKLIFRVICGCGWWTDVKEAESGQCLGGTAADKAARHDAVCQAKKTEAKATPIFVDRSTPSHTQKGGVKA